MGIGIDSCYESIHGRAVRFERGDVLVLETDYYGAPDDPRLVGGDDAGGEHENVMSMFFLGVVLDGASDYHDVVTTTTTTDGRHHQSSFNLWNDFVPQLPSAKKKYQRFFR